MAFPVLELETVSASREMLDRIREARLGVLAWLESVREPDVGWGRWRYHARSDAPRSLNASGLAIQVLGDLGALANLSEEQKAESAGYFRDCQDAPSGLFKDPLETEAEKLPRHSWEQVWGQRHGSVLEAMAYLPFTPRYPVARQQFADLGAVDPALWTRKMLDWGNPWQTGETWSRAMRAFRMAKPDAERAAADERLLPAFEAFESEILDGTTGYPSRRMPDALPHVAMAGCFKVMQAYVDTGRPVPAAEAAISATLGLQNPDGTFGPEDNMCFNWDALFILRVLDRQERRGFRHADIVAAANRCVEALLTRYLQPDGGFAFFGNECLDSHHSIRVSAERHPIGDMLGTRMCVLCLGYAEEWNAEPAEHEAAGLPAREAVPSS